MRFSSVCTLDVPVSSGGDTRGRIGNEHLMGVIIRVRLVSGVVASLIQFAPCGVHGWFPGTDVIELSDGKIFTLCAEHLRCAEVLSLPTSFALTGITVGAKCLRYAETFFGSRHQQRHHARNCCDDCWGSARLCQIRQGLVFRSPWFWCWYVSFLKGVSKSHQLQ